MPNPQIASYASWASPITSDLIVASSIGLGDILTDGRDIYWIESRPQERGRSVIVRCSQDGGPADVTPPIPSDSQVHIDAKGTTASSDFSGLDAHRGRLQGMLGDGHEGTIELRTSAGSVTLAKT